MKYLSLFSGIGGFELAISLVFPDAECVGFSEIDKYAIQVYKKHFPDHENLGSICDIKPEDLPDFDLLVGGFPCQDLSIAKKDRKGLQGERSGLFYKMAEILKLKKPKWFIFENVASMSKDAVDEISRTIGQAGDCGNDLFNDYVHPVMINSALVSAQQRKRLFWTNFHIHQPADRGIVLKDILESGETIKGEEKAYCLDAHYSNGGLGGSQYFGKHKRALIKLGNVGNSNSQGNRVYSIEGKSCNLSANGGGLGAKTGLYQTDEGRYRKLTPIECERLQTFPDGWTGGISNSQRYKCLGNAVTVEVIKHILTGI